MSREHEAPRLLGLEGALELDARTNAELFACHVNPGLATLYRWLGTAELDIVGGAGAELHLRDGTRLLDASSALGATTLGHGSALVAEAQARFAAVGGCDALKVAPPRWQSALAHDLVALAPPGLEIVSFSPSGAEAVEAALKLCERGARGGRDRFVVFEGSFHGKTHSALALTRAGNFQDGLLLGLRAEQVVEVPFDDLGALERVLDADARAPGGPRLLAVVAEPVQGQAVRVPREDWLAGAIALARRHGIRSIVDEVKSGLLRTGAFTRCTAAGVTPDVLVLGKGLGGGRHALGATLCRRDVFERAYGSTSDAAHHTSTFGGLGEACAVALAVVGWMARRETQACVAERARELDVGLHELAERRSRRVAGVRGLGLFRGLVLRPDERLSDAWPGLRSELPFRALEAAYTAGVVRELALREHVLAHFCASDPDVLHLMPPLDVSREQIARLLQALDAVLDRPPLALVSALALARLRGGSA